MSCPCWPQSSDDVMLEGQVLTRLQRGLRPSVFDSLDIRVDKLNVLTLSYAADQDQSEFMCDQDAKSLTI